MAPDFSTGATLELEVSDSSLRDAKNTIESELGNLEVDVNAIVSGGGGGRQPRDPSSGRFMAMEGVEQRVVNSNEHLEDIRNILLDMDDKIGGGGMMAAGGGGGGGLFGAGMLARGGLLAGGGAALLGGGALGIGHLLQGGMGRGGNKGALWERVLGVNTTDKTEAFNDQDPILSGFEWPPWDTPFRWPWEDKPDKEVTPVDPTGSKGNNLAQSWSDAVGLGEVNDSIGQGGETPYVPGSGGNVAWPGMTSTQTNASIGSSTEQQSGRVAGPDATVEVTLEQTIDGREIGREAARKAEEGVKQELQRIERELEDMKDQISRGLR